ncbi:tRNA (N6-threonylcarbamoyladenosine(37)-N6)-methyltransferase TrmO [Candidatus Bathyarchaeota archaeon]|nr:tRNA (N6-threonylcarbamoyladenosine(37)-N6)-methyltransferase TrmO [Candidatus Bathyarchaeota archaeon]
MKGKRHSLDGRFRLQVLLLHIEPIARVVNGVTECVDDWSGIESTLVFEKEFAPGLFRLGQHSNIWVLFGFHRVRGWKERVHPRHDPKRRVVGVFASRSPNRPNRIGLTLVELISVRGNTVRVRGLDALDGSPVFDIKPYVAEMDEEP